MAGAQFRKERPGHTLQPTALVHEVYLRVVGRKTKWLSPTDLPEVRAPDRRSRAASSV